MSFFTRRFLGPVGAVLLAQGLCAAAPASTPAPALPEDAAAAPLPTAPLVPPTASGTARVRVQVRSARDGKPLPGTVAAILRQLDELQPPAIETTPVDDSGTATFEATRAGVFNVCARGAGHSAACSPSVGVVTGGSAEVVLELPPGATVVGQVRHADGSPAAGIRMLGSEHSAHPPFPPETVTDAQGRFRFSGLVPGDFSAMPAPPEGHFRTREVKGLRVGEERQLDMPLEALAQVTVAPVADPKHWKGPVDSVRLGFIPLTRQPDGTWQGAMEAGTYSLLIDGPEGLRMWREAVKLAPGKTVMQPRLVAGPREELFGGRWTPGPREPFELAGHVLLADGRPVKAAHVAFELPPQGWCGNVPRRYSEARFEGSAFVVNPPSNTRGVPIYAWLDDGRAGHVTVSAKPGERAVANITLEETGAVVGRFASDSGGRTGALDLVVDNRWTGAWQFTEEDGSFFVAGLAPGKHVLNVPNHPPVSFEVKARQRTDLGLVRR